MDNNGYYQDKISIVTGGNSGIGYALCEELLKRGGTVYLAGRDQKKVAEAAGQLSAFRDRVRTLIVDVTKQEQVQKAIERTAKEAGRLDMLFNNAGIFKPMLFETGTLDDWRAMIDTNLWSVIYGVQAAIPIMLRQGSGHIVNTSSLAGLVPYPMQVIYDTTKYAVVGLSESLRYEYAEKGIRVSVICPGDIATPVFSKIVDSKGREHPFPRKHIPLTRRHRTSLTMLRKATGGLLFRMNPITSSTGDISSGTRRLRSSC